MSLLSTIFNRPDIAVSRTELAAIVAPFIAEASPITNEAIATGLAETAEWLRIGFDGENNKGSLYHALYYGLKCMEQSVRSAPAEAESFTIKRSFLAAIKAGKGQLYEASRALDFMSQQKANYKPTYIKDTRGNMLQLPFTEIYNRPGADHYLMAIKLEEVLENLQAYFADKTIKPASARALESYLPRPR